MILRLLLLLLLQVVRGAFYPRFIYHETQNPVVRIPALHNPYCNTTADHVFCRAVAVGSVCTSTTSAPCRLEDLAALLPQHPMGLHVVDNGLSALPGFRIDTQLFDRGTNHEITVELPDSVVGVFGQSQVASNISLLPVFAVYTTNNFVQCWLQEAPYALANDFNRYCCQEATFSTENTDIDILEIPSDATVFRTHCLDIPIQATLPIQQQPFIAPNAPSCSWLTALVAVCSTVSGYRRVPILALSTNASSEVVTIRTEFCTNQCRWPCITSPRDDACLVQQQQDDLVLRCLPQARRRLCSRDVAARQYGGCRFYEVPFALRKNVASKQTCSTGDINCGLVQCRCFLETGCPNHEFCAFRGTLFEVAAAAADAATRDAGAVCVCNPGFAGSRCEHVFQQQDCDRSQETRPELSEILVL